MTDSTNPYRAPTAVSGSNAAEPRWPDRQYEAVDLRAIYWIAMGLALFGVLMAIGTARAGRPEFSAIILACVALFDVVWLTLVKVRRKRSVIGAAEDRQTTP